MTFEELLNNWGFPHESFSQCTNVSRINKFFLQNFPAFVFFWHKTWIQANEWINEQSLLKISLPRSQTFYFNGLMGGVLMIFVRLSPRYIKITIPSHFHNFMSSKNSWIRFNFRNRKRENIMSYQLPIKAYNRKSVYTKERGKMNCKKFSAQHSSNFKDTQVIKLIKNNARKERKKESWITEHWIFEWMDLWIHRRWSCSYYIHLFVPVFSKSAEQIDTSVSCSFIIHNAPSLDGKEDNIASSLIMTYATVQNYRLIDLAPLRHLRLVQVHIFW